MLIPGGLGCLYAWEPPWSALAKILFLQKTPLACSGRRLKLGLQRCRLGAVAAGQCFCVLPSPLHPPPSQSSQTHGMPPRWGCINRMRPFSYLYIQGSSSQCLDFANKDLWQTSDVQFLPKFAAGDLRAIWSISCVTSFKCWLLMSYLSFSQTALWVSCPCAVHNTKGKSDG